MAFVCPTLNRHWKLLGISIRISKSYLKDIIKSILFNFKRTDKIMVPQSCIECNAASQCSYTGAKNFEQLLLWTFATRTHIKGIKCQNAWHVFSMSCQCHLLVLLCNIKIKTLMDFMGKISEIITATLIS